MNNGNILVWFFDLDNCLIDQYQYNMGAFRLIAELLHKELGIDFNKALTEIEGVYRKNTMEGKTNLDEIVNNFGIKFPIVTETGKQFKNVKHLVNYLVTEGYHGYVPEHLEPYEGALEVLKTLQDNTHYIQGEKGRTKLACITDGNALTQQRKVMAAGFENMFDLILYTEQMDSSKRKSAAPFVFVADCFGIPKTLYPYIVVVGDNPRTDFKYPNKLGMKTVRVLTGEHSNKEAKGIYAPDYTVKNLRDILEIRF